MCSCDLARNSCYISCCKLRVKGPRPPPLLVPLTSFTVNLCLIHSSLCLNPQHIQSTLCSSTHHPYGGGITQRPEPSHMQPAKSNKSHQLCQNSETFKSPECTRLKFFNHRIMLSVFLAFNTGPCYDEHQQNWNVFRVSYKENPKTFDSSGKR